MERNFRLVEDGNTVRKVYTAPARKKTIYVEPHRRTIKSPRPENKMGLGLTMLLAASVAVAVVICLLYLNVQTEASGLKNNILALQNEVTDITAKNDALEYEVDSYVDLDYIYQVATEELGMKMAKEEQVVGYASSKNEYMEQYADVPEK